MTLHWWMHWFWVTAQFIVILGNPVPSSTEPARVLVHDLLSTNLTSEIPSGLQPTRRGAISVRQNFRIAKAIGPYPQPNTAVVPDRQVGTVAIPMERTAETTINSIVEGIGANGSIVAGDGDSRRPAVSQRMLESPERMRNLTKKDTKITWILTTNKTGRSKYEQEEKSPESLQRNGGEDDAEDLTVLPLREEVSRVRLVLNRTRPSAALLSSSSLSSSAGAAGSKGIRTFNRSDDDVEIDEEFVEPQLFATAASIREVGVSESTRLSRARSAFPKDFQRDQIQGDDHLSDYNDSNTSENSERGGTTRSAVDIAAITGSCLATVVLLSTMGSLGFIMYRRRYLNPPQTLNSDKCSNPDSSGYIDDSTIRDNSEEMYSLDNDSFLNSLEAMTIQNYWTDSVKHTKL